MFHMLTLTKMRVKSLLSEATEKQNEQKATFPTSCFQRSQKSKSWITTVATIAQKISNVTRLTARYTRVAKPALSTSEPLLGWFLLLLNHSVLGGCCHQQSLSSFRDRLTTHKPGISRAKQAACCTNSHAAITFTALPHSLGRARRVSTYYTRKVIRWASVLFTN